MQLSSFTKLDDRTLKNPKKRKLREMRFHCNKLNVPQNRKVDKCDLLEWDTNNTRGHGKKQRKANYRKSIKRFSFPHRNIDTLNKLDK